MATEDILVRYRSDVSQLEADLDKVILQQYELINNEKKGSDAAKKSQTTQEFVAKKRLEVLKVEIQRLNTLKKARDLAYDPKKIEGFNKEIENSKKRIGLLKGETESLGSAGSRIFKQIGAGIIAAFSIQAVKQFAESSINAFLEQEKAIERLRFATVVLNGETQATFDRLIRQSEELQRVTIFADDKINEAQASLAAFGLTGRQIEELTPKLADLATVMGTDINTAAQQVGAGLQGVGRELKRYGIIVSATGTQQENLNAILEGSARFAGSAENAAKTLGGELDQLKNRSGDLQEEIGAKLTPAWVKLKTAIFEATLSLINYGNTAKVKLKDAEVSGETQAKNTIDNLKSQGLSTDELIEKIRKLASEEKAQADKLELDLVLRVRKQELSRLEAEARGREVAQVRAIVQAYNDAIDSIKEKAAEDARALSKEKLRTFTIEQLNEALIANTKLNDIVSKDNVKLIEQELELRKKQGEEAKKLREKEAEELRKLRLQQFEDFKKLLDDELNALERSIDRQSTRAKELQDLLEFKIRFTLAKDGEEAAFLQAREELFKIYENEQITADVTSDTVDEANAKKQKSYEKYIEALKKLVGDFSIFEQEKTKESLSKFIEENAEVLNASAQLIGELSSLYAVFSQKRIDQIEQEKEAQLSSIDQSLKANDDALKKRRITETEAEAQKQRLLDERVKAEEAANKKIRAEKRKIAILDKAAALVQIAINTAQAVTKAAAQTGVGGIALGPIMAALGAAQAAIVIAQPIPYKKGSKDTGAKGHLARVGEQGEEITYMPPKSKVLPAPQTNHYGKVLDAMFDFKLDDYIDQNYVTPALMAQKKMYEDQQSENFASNIAKSIYYQSGLSIEDMDLLRRKGQRINNAEEIADILASKLRPILQRDIYR